MNERMNENYQQCQYVQDLWMLSKLRWYILYIFACFQDKCIIPQRMPQSSFIEKLDTRHFSAAVECKKRKSGNTLFSRIGRFLWLE